MTSEIEGRTVDVDEMLVRPGTYFNPQTEIVVIVDDSTSIDQEIFNMEAYEGSDWVRISDDLPVDEDGLAEALEEFQTHYHPGTAGAVSATALEQGDGTDDEDDEERGSGARAARIDGRLLGRQARGRHGLDGRLPGLWRDALVLGGVRYRAGLLQLANDAARHRRPWQLWAPAPRPGGGLFRDRRPGHVQDRRRCLRGRPPHRGADRRRRLPLGSQRQPTRTQSCSCSRPATPTPRPSRPTTSGPTTDRVGRRPGPGTRRPSRCRFVPL